jgi:tetratricopeptide (TPR) repeat protein
MTRVASSIVVGLIGLMFSIPPAAFATNPVLDKAIKAYHSGNYALSIGLFGQAATTEFNNPILHYYLANALAKTNQTKDAIKEYKIALAQEPDGQIANYCKEALAALGAEEGAGKSKKSGSSKPLAFSYNFDVHGNPQEIEGKMPNGGTFKLRRSASGSWVLRETRNSRELNISGVPIEVKPDGTILGRFYVSNQGDMTYISPTKVRNVIRRDGTVDDGMSDTFNTLIQALTPAEQRVVDDAAAIMQKANVRIKEEERKTDVAVRQIRNNISESNASANRYNREDVAEYRKDGERRIKMLYQDLERKKKEIYAEAQSRVDLKTRSEGGNGRPAVTPRR